MESGDIFVNLCQLSVILLAFSVKMIPGENLFYKAKLWSLLHSETKTVFGTVYKNVSKCH